MGAVNDLKKLGRQPEAEKQNEPLLEIRNLKTHFFAEEGVVKAVDGVDLTVNRGEVLGLVGESGCGKSVTSLSIIRLVEQPGEVVEGTITFDGISLLDLPKSEMVRIRGNRISMIFQQPQASLDPIYKVGDQLSEALQANNDVGKQEGWQRAVELLRMVGIPDPERRVHAYPHELSGGMAQRVMIAMAMARVPDLIIADEPTTALDVTIQAQILDLLRRLRSEMGTAVILVTHDLGVVAEIAERVAVMYAGHIVEETDVKTLFAQPRHPYTQGLIQSVPVLGEVKDKLNVIPGTVPNPIDLPVGCKFAPRCTERIEHGLVVCTEVDPELKLVGKGHTVRCWLYHDSQEHTAPLGHQVKGAHLRVAERRPYQAQAREPTAETEAAGTAEAKDGERPDPQSVLLRVENLVKYFPVRGGLLRRTQGYVRAVDDVSFSIKAGETLGLVGESGCGKTTVGRTILRLTEATGGAAYFEGQNIFDFDQRQLKSLRRDMQIIFQDPYSSLNSRMPVGENIAEGLLIHGLRDARQREEIVIDLLRRVGLEDYHARRFPHEFSGGQRQRIGIARALALQPKFIVCDEPVSALDVSIQSHVLNLLDELQAEFDLTYLFIAHNLSVVEHISDRVAVMYLGKIVEMASRERLYNSPQHPYTQALLSAIPIPDPMLQRHRIILEGGVPSPLNPPGGCRFHTRCPVAMEHCTHQEPPFKEYEEGHWAACWLLE
jgi:peptide/nickel transport system ATP-binding protein